MSDEELACTFAEHRPYLHAMAYRMLGSHADADDVVQEAWIRLARVGGGIAELRGWLTIVTSRICLDLLRARGVRRAQPLEISLSTPPSSQVGNPSSDPEQEALLAEEISLALYVVMDALTSSERVAFVLQDVFGVPFSSVAAVLGCSTNAARMLASRARGKVRLNEPGVPANASGRVDRDVINAFFAAARLGDIDRLLDVLAPGVELQAVGPAGGSIVRGAAEVAARAAMFARPDARRHPAVVDGLPGVLITVDGRPVTVFSFTIEAGKVTAIKTVNDPRLAQVLPTWAS